MSSARIPILLTVGGKFDVKGELFRNVAPCTVGALMRVGKFEGWAILHDYGFMLITNVRAGLEKARNKFSRGEIGFLPINGSLWFFTKDAEVDRPMNPVGMVLTPERLKDVSRGDRLTLIIGKVS